MTRRVLVVDDDALLRRSLKLQLGRSGWEVYEAEDGQVAWDLIQRESLRLIITDWSMPVMNGYELVQRIRSGGLPSYTYIIVLTANQRKLDVVAGLEAGADDYLTKPFDTDELRARVAIGARILELEAQLRASLAKVEELAVRDALTGLYNRRAFDTRLADEVQRSLRYQRPLSLVMIDIDFFKCYNDAHGHPQGDRLLRELAGLLTACVRSTDFVARYGGEEFALILPETNASSALAVAHLVHARVGANPFPLAESQPGGALSLSLGVASRALEWADAEALLQAADQALYKAKRSGRSQVWAAG